MVERRAAPAIAGADLELGEAVQHVELGQRDAVDAGDLHRLAHHHRVEPPTAPLAPGDHAELLAARAPPLADRVGEFGRERAAADAGGISFRNAKDIADGPDTQPGAPAAASCSRAPK